MPTSVDPAKLTPPTMRLKGRYILLALAAHGLLLLGLSANFHWRSETPPPSQAELWVELPNIVRTPQAPIQNQTIPQPPKQQPEVKPPEALPDVDIALEEERRQQAERERLAAEEKARQEQAERERLAAEEKARQEQAERERLAAEEKARQEQAERERLAAEEKARQEQAERERLAAEEKARQEQTERERLAAEEKARQEQARREQARREAQQRERLRQENLNRIQGMAGGQGNSNVGAVGTAGGSGRASQAYIGRLSGIVRRNITYTGDTSKNPTTVIYVETDKTGKIIKVQIRRSSGNHAWDDAVERALWKTAVLPPDVNGKRPATTFLFNLRPNE